MLKPAIIQILILPIGQIISQKFTAIHFKKYTTVKNNSIDHTLAKRLVEKKSFI
jgi:hypothetical protein